MHGLTRWPEAATARFLGPVRTLAALGAIRSNRSADLGGTSLKSVRCARRCRPGSCPAGPSAAIGLLRQRPFANMRTAGVWQLIYMFTIMSNTYCDNPVGVRPSRAGVGRPRRIGGGRGGGAGSEADEATARAHYPSAGACRWHDEAASRSPLGNGAVGTGGTGRVPTHSRLTDTVVEVACSVHGSRRTRQPSVGGGCAWHRRVQARPDRVDGPQG